MPLVGCMSSWFVKSEVACSCGDGDCSCSAELGLNLKRSLAGMKALVIRPESFMRSSRYIPFGSSSRTTSMSLFASFDFSELQNTMSPGLNVGSGVDTSGCVLRRRSCWVLIMSSWLKSKLAPVTMSRPVHNSMADMVDHLGFELSTETASASVDGDIFSLSGAKARMTS